MIHWSGKETKDLGPQVHTRLGEVLFTTAMNDNVEDQVKTLSEACQRFCRCIELCDDYIRGYYGLKKVRLCDIW